VKIFNTIKSSIWKIQGVFPGASNYMIRRTKQFVMVQGIMSSPNPKPSRALNEVTAEAVKSFYNSDQVSTVMFLRMDDISKSVALKQTNRNDCCCAI
jgi:hypothetical protein